MRWYHWHPQVRKSRQTRQTREMSLLSNARGHVFNDGVDESNVTAFFLLKVSWKVLIARIATCTKTKAKKTVVVSENCNCVSLLNFTVYPLAFKSLITYCFSLRRCLAPESRYFARSVSASNSYPESPGSLVSGKSPDRKNRGLWVRHCECFGFYFCSVQRFGSRITQCCVEALQRGVKNEWTPASL